MSTDGGSICPPQRSRSAQPCGWCSLPRCCERLSQARAPAGDESPSASSLQGPCSYPQRLRAQHSPPATEGPPGAGLQRGARSAASTVGPGAHPPSSLLRGPGPPEKNSALNLRVPGRHLAHTHTQPKPSPVSSHLPGPASRNQLWRHQEDVVRKQMFLFTSLETSVSWVHLLAYLPIGRWLLESPQPPAQHTKPLGRAAAPEALVPPTALRRALPPPYLPSGTREAPPCSVLPPPQRRGVERCRHARRKHSCWRRGSNWGGGRGPGRSDHAPLRWQHLSQAQGRSPNSCFESHFPSPCRGLSPTLGLALPHPPHPQSKGLPPRSLHRGRSFVLSLPLGPLGVPSKHGPWMHLASQTPAGGTPLWESGSEVPPFWTSTVSGY